uniref:Uncharacterized protein n=1 Tax=Vespula pensylvanica TaxID=30213 RepID=A0A834U448_VESPE|nr:hypothetical protein H0235_012437 [Vespula pensylvanica]
MSITLVDSLENFSSGLSDTPYNSDTRLVYIRKTTPFQQLVSPYVYFRVLFMKCGPVYRFYEIRSRKCRYGVTSGGTPRFPIGSSSNENVYDGRYMFAEFFDLDKMTITNHE